MRLSRSESVGKKRKDQKFRNKLKGKKKHKRLDAICEKAYNRSHREVEPSDSDDGGDKLELRRSGRARKAPVLLDSSPLPPKKRQKLDRSGVSSAEKVFKEEGLKRGRGSSSSKDLDGRNRGWRSRLRSGGKSARFSGRKRGEFSLRGKRKLFEDFDGVKEDLKTQDDDKKAGSVGEESTVVKSKRSGRVEASNVFENENQDVDLEGGEQDDKEKNGNDVLEVIDEGDGSFSETKSAGRSELGAEDVCITAKPGDRIAESEFLLEECHINGNVETGEENVGLQKLASDNVLDKRYAAKFDSAADQEKDEMHTDKHLEDETHKKSDEKYNAFTVVNHKPRLKLGRRCGLCGGGTDGKPPKVLVRDGNDSENEVYSGSSASEEPNYDVWDGFGNDSGWLGRLLGPINDRFGIAGIWVHQQCAVWSPEVYFAGLGCLKNVRAALYRGRVLKCGRCRRPGATIGCRVDRCPKTYHVPCARAKGCIFDHRKFLIACTDHRHLFQPHGLQNALRLKKLKSKKMKLELRKMSNDASRKDIEAEEKWLENCGEDEEFLKRESKRLQRDLYRIAPVYIGGTSSGSESKFQGWDSVAGLQDVIQCMKEVVILPLLYPEFFNNLGLTPPRGVLLHGYPGTGKTLVVRALVGACARGDKRIAYFARKGADCLGKYVGDAERQLRLLFHVAEKSQPSIIFFDEIDGLAPCRTKQQDQTHSSVVSTLLALMDGLKSRGSVIVIGATNRPDAVDPALRRPGRFDREIYFPLPSVKDREAILSLHTQKWPKPITGSLLKWVAKQTIGFAGADLQALCTQAAMIALRRGFPLQEVLSAAETKMSDSRRPSIPTFSVEERDWLQAMSCVPPPCSQRDSGIAVNDVVAAPLNTFLVPCLLRPLTRLLVRLYLDECIWLPPPLTKASTLLKDVFVSALNNRRVQSDNWWSHVDSLLQEVNIMNEIEKNFLLANVLVGQVNLCSSNVPAEFHDESFKKVFPNSLNMGARSNLIKSISSASCNKSGFQMLISGEPKSGQRHLASCLLHCFVGNVDVWKIDLASLSHEGHGDMVHGLTRILMRSSSANLSMIYMPRIDLWAIETYSEAPEDNPELSSLEPQSSGNMLCNGHYEINNGHEFCPRAEADVTESQTALKKASYLWTSFIEQVESMRVNTSLIILATSELPLSLFPLRVRQFFGGEIVGCSLSSPLDQKVPRFSVQLDGKLEPDEVISSFAMKLSRDLAQHFVQLIHGRNHIHENLPEEKAYNKVDSDDNRVCPSKSSPEGLLSPVAFANKTVKGKSSLLLAISTVGYQILCYPHFAELCWVTSKLKEGPFANVNGPLKGWPFNSCIVRPTSSVENVVSSGSGNIKSKESGVVRGLVAVGLSAYRGEYTSLRKVCLELRRVSEILVRQIDNKIQAGKDRTHFMHLLSQVSYLEDMVISWAHNLKSLEVDNPISEANINTYTGSAATDVCKDGVSEVDGHRVDATIHGSKGPEESPRKIDAKDVGHFDSSNCDNACGDAAHDVAVTVAAEPSQLADVEKHSSAPNEINLESSKEEASKDHTEEVGNVGSAKLSNGFTESCSGIQADGPRLPVDKHNFELFHSTEVSNNSTGSSSNNNISCANASENLGARDVDVDRASSPTSFTGSSFAKCFYQCCSECYANLHSLLLKIINSEWGLKRDSSVEGVHDFVSSLSANLHLAVCKLLQTGNLSGPGWEEGNTYRKRFECRKCQETNMPECRKSEKSMMMEYSCHTMSENSSRHEDFSEIYHGVEPRFIFKNGVLDALDAGTDVSYHCKFDKICLCFLIEWLARSKNIFD